MDLLTILLFLAGFVLLVAGAEVLVRGAANLAVAAGIAPLVVGLTVVAFGTSAPELAVTLQAAWSPGATADIAMGNVVGSNICNVLLILGLSAWAAPLVVTARVVWLEVPLMIASALAVAVVAWDGRITTFDGILLAAGLIAYITFTLIQAMRGRELPAAAQTDVPDAKPSNPAINLLLVAAGVLMLTAGSRWLVMSAVDIAHFLGVSELVVGLTIVAVGTSLPELATSVMAALRGERDIAVGNVLGSNIFNCLSVLGFGAAIAPDGIQVSPSVIAFDLPVMLATAVACLPIFLTGHNIARWEGFLLVGYYIAYTAYLILDATGHDALELYSDVMLVFVIPITVITIGIAMVRHLHRNTPPA